MRSLAQHHRYTYRDYLDLERAANVKHEFLDGEIYAMAGGTPEHAALAMAVGSVLFTRLRGGPCRVFSSDLSVRVLETGLATYPDVSVVRGDLERDPESAVTVTNPRLVVEVTSDGTEAYDRGEKLEHYRRIPSLAAILVISHRERRFDLWTRRPDGAFDVATARRGEAVTIDPLELSLEVDEVYGDILARS